MAYTAYGSMVSRVVRLYVTVLHWDFLVSAVSAVSTVNTVSLFETVCSCFAMAGIYGKHGDRTFFLLWKCAAFLYDGDSTGIELFACGLNQLCRTRPLDSRSFFSWSSTKTAFFFGLAMARFFFRLVRAFFFFWCLWCG